MPGSASHVDGCRRRRRLMWMAAADTMRSVSMSTPVVSVSKASMG
jgi:hypothetical protein